MEGWKKLRLRLFAFFQSSIPPSFLTHTPGSPHCRTRVSPRAASFRQSGNLDPVWQTAQPGGFRATHLRIGSRANALHEDRTERRQCDGVSASAGGNSPCFSKRRARLMVASRSRPVCRALRARKRAVEITPPRLEIDEEIDIAVWPRFAPRHGAEDTHASDAVPASQLQDGGAMAHKVIGQGHHNLLSDTLIVHEKPRPVLVNEAGFVVPPAPAHRGRLYASSGIGWPPLSM